MGPRKRPKPNPQAEAQSETPPIHTTDESLPQPEHRFRDSEQENEITTEANDSGSSAAGANTSQSIKSWYGGSWPRGAKATPVKQVAKESVLASKEATPPVVASTQVDKPPISSRHLKSPAGSLSHNVGSSSRSLPLVATTTKLNISSNNPRLAKESVERGQSLKPIVQGRPSADGEVQVEKFDEQNGEGPSFTSHASQVDKGRTTSSDKNLQNGDSASWRTWFYKAETPHSPVTNNDRPDLKKQHPEGKSQSEVSKNDSRDARDPTASPNVRRHSEPMQVSHNAQQDDQPRSWLSLWGTTASQLKSNASARATGTASIASEQPEEAAIDRNLHSDVGGQSKISPQPPPQLAAIPKPSGWAFWSKNEATDEDRTRASGSELGELAQVGSSSHVDPPTVTLDERRGILNKVEKRKRPPSLRENTGISQSAKNEKNKDMDQETTRPKSIADTTLQAKRHTQNLLLPSFKHTYRSLGRPGLIQQLSRLFQSSWAPESKRIEIVPNAPRIKRALAIGVHGYFPAPLIRSVLGQPTGTSIRFANSAANAIHKWTQVRGYACEIEKVALEGEGKIAERIELLWKLLLNWIDKIQKADFVLIACHSQGVPVAMMLVAKLIAFGCVNSAKVGVCAMAGVNLGPFADYKSRWISGSAGELFEFAESDSQVSKDYQAALNVVLRFGVRIVYVGSIDDQLVSLESSTFGTVSHPYIYRAVFVDGRVHAPDFLTHLVGFALKLRNLGISDHGLIRELSTPLAGSLYGGEGHSRIYDDEAVYYLAVEHALETSSVGNAPVQVQPNIGTGSQNPYILPFAMRGLLEEEYVRTEMHGEITELIRQFDDWKPSSKVLKDVKFRLEGVRSKL